MKTFEFLLLGNIDSLLEQAGDVAKSTLRSLAAGANSIGVPTLDAVRNLRDDAHDYLRECVEHYGGEFPQLCDAGYPYFLLLETAVESEKALCAAAAKFASALVDDMLSFFESLYRKKLTRAERSDAAVRLAQIYADIVEVRRRIACYENERRRKTVKEK